MNTDSSITKSWAGQSAVLATMHGKEQVIAPAVRDAFGIDLTVAEGVNTDQFGTFTKEISRAADQYTTARKKAEYAMDTSEHTLAIASEGSFGTNPRIPFLSWNLELVVLVDRTHSLTVAGYYGTSDTLVKQQSVQNATEAETLARTWGFPTQGIIVRHKPNSSRHLYKDCRTMSELRSCVNKILKRPFSTRAWLETDMRAHRNPKRMHAIAAATQDLLRNCRLCCPRCTAPGFTRKHSMPGLRCQLCGRETEYPKAFVHSCQCCDYSETRPNEQSVVTPEHCDFCNP
jgi:hypothetical protein